MMLHDHETAIRKSAAELEMMLGLRAFGERPDDRHAIDSASVKFGQLQTGGNRFVGEFACDVTPRGLLLFCRGRQLAILKDCAGRVVEDTANSKYDHRLLSALLDLGPGVAEGHSAVEHAPLGRGVSVHAEVAETLELIAGTRLGVSESRLNLAA